MYDALKKARGTLADAIAGGNQTSIGNAIFDMEALIVANCLFVDVLNPSVFFKGPDQFLAPNIRFPGNVSEQVTLPGDLRPDLVVRLAGGRSVVVDAKVTLAAYLEAVESTDADFREARMTAHARHLRQHVDALADKAYWQSLPDAPEFVVLFVPGEAFLAPALERDPALLEHAYARRVHIATPTTLVSLLRTVAYAWQQESLTENAQAVFAAGKELYARLTTLGGHVDKLGRTLNTAVTDYNRTVASLERNLLPSARRMADLGVVQDELLLPRAVDAVSSRLVSPELTLVPVQDERLSG
jgi:DNA recombination protein RmuC